MESSETSEQPQPSVSAAAPPPDQKDDEKRGVVTSAMASSAVHPGTFSTGTPVPPPNPNNAIASTAAATATVAVADGSEVSVMTADELLLDNGQQGGTAMLSSSEMAIEKEETETASSDSRGSGRGVPEHVILEENENEIGGGGSDGGSGEDGSTSDVVVVNPPPLIVQAAEQGAAAAAAATAAATATAAAPNDADTTVSDPLPDASSPRATTAKAALLASEKTSARSASIDETNPPPPPGGGEGEGDPDTDEDDNFDEYIRSPEVQNAIVERSPGERYVRFMEKLGSGASKDVYRAYDTQEGIEVAWNVVNLAGVPKNERNRIVNEVRLLERLHHHNIISFHGSWVNRERQEVNFVTEILSSGTLKSFIAKVQVIRWKIAKRWAVQILKGLEYLHSQDPPVIHRDLKCENIFINGTSGDLRIGDLGLSTVHRNGRVLSVLGTPEFMAPDMYEEGSYDEKVDIYAFGMCMLEIFTKEIPFRECNNPAQIYKRVSSGEPPEVLSRLQSRHAREFVLLCLGYKDENGKYVRPSATELLQHPFLVERASESDEVVVDPPLRERAIPEVGEPATLSGGSGTPTKQQAQSTDASNVTPSKARSTDTATPPPPHHRPASSRGSLDEDLSDKFDEMPQTESNFMKKVTVMMGRNQELEEDEAIDGAAIPEEQQQGSSFPPAPNTSLLQHYLVAAAVIGNEGPDNRPYPDDILKLVVTLPVEGQTQNVQFDFHLVQDDPVQVAKEMVQELGIPQGAVLEISETISRLARSARMKVDDFYSRHGHIRAPSQQSIPGGQQLHVDPSQAQAQAQVQSQHETTQGMMYQEGQPIQQAPPPPPPPQHQPGPAPDYSNAVHQAAAPAPPQQQQQGHFSDYSNAVHQNMIPAQQQGVQMPNQSVAQQQQQQPVYVQHHQGITYGNTVPSQNQPTQPSPYTSHQTPVPPPPVQGNNAPMHAPHAVHPEHLMHGQPQAIPPQHDSGLPPGMASQQGVNVQQPQQVAAQHGMHAQLAPVPATQPQPGMTPSPPSAQSLHAAQNVQVAISQGTVLADGSGPPPAGLPTSAPPSTHARQATPPEMNSLPVLKPAQRSSTNGTTGSGSPNNSGHKRRQLSFSSSSPPEQTSPTNATDSEDADPDLGVELRKLDEDFQRNLQRAKKVFDNRMDNLQRSQIERDAQHQKTLEKHEKERAEFEKRLAQEEEQQNRRLEQLQRDWDKRRETLALQKKSEGVEEDYTVANRVHPAPNPELSAPSGTGPPPPPAPAVAGTNPANPAAPASGTSPPSAPVAEYNQQVDMNGGLER